MVLQEIFMALVNFPKNLLADYIPVPEILGGPFLPIPAPLLVFLGVLVISMLISRFSGIKITLYLMLVMTVSGFVLGGFYFMLLSFVFSSPLLFAAKIKRKKGDDDDYKEPEKSEDSGLGEADEGIKSEDSGSGLDSELSLDSAEDSLGDEQKPQPPEAIAPQQRVCPYCGMPLAYIEQYRRFYCYHCKRYV